MTKFVLMLTRDDVTVPDAHAILELALAAGTEHIGFKDIAGNWPTSTPSMMPGRWSANPLRNGYWKTSSSTGVRPGNRLACNLPTTSRHTKT